VEFEPTVIKILILGLVTFMISGQHQGKVRSNQHIYFFFSHGSNDRSYLSKAFLNSVGIVNPLHNDRQLRCNTCMTCGYSSNYYDSLKWVGFGSNLSATCSLNIGECSSEKKMSLIENRIHIFINLKKKKTERSRSIGHESNSHIYA
jgi:hypothetical protein